MERTYVDPFGEKVGEDGEAISPLLGDVKLGFTSHRHDDDLGLINMRGRIFDPVQKRFLTPDPYVPAPLSGQSYNRFAYVFNNSLRYTDPSGFSPPAGDLKTKGGTTEPDIGAMPAPVPLWPQVLTGPVNQAEVDHIKRRSEGGGNEPSNLRVLCPQCNAGRERR